MLRHVYGVVSCLCVVSPLPTTPAPFSYSFMSEGSFLSLTCKNVRKGNSPDIIWRVLSFDLVLPLARMPRRGHSALWGLAEISGWEVPWRCLGRLGDQVLAPSGGMWSRSCGRLGLRRRYLGIPSFLNPTLPLPLCSLLVFSSRLCEGGSRCSLPVYELYTVMAWKSGEAG